MNANQTTASGSSETGSGRFSQTRLDRIAGLYVTDAYQQAFKEELAKIGKEIQTPGSRLNRLVTKQ